MKTNLAKAVAPKVAGVNNLSWTPVRRGRIFCSPACGGGCTKAEYDSRMRDGVELAKRLGEGWKAEVHENLGWYLSIYSPCGRIQVNVRYHHKRHDRIIGFAAFLNHAKDQPGGKWVGHGKTPEAAIADAIKLAMAARNEINAILEGIDVYVPGSIQAASQRARREAARVGYNFDDGGLP